MLAVSIDVDWAPDPVIRDTISLLDEYDISATIFSTHNDGVDTSGHDRAIHPNFFREGQTEAEALEELDKLYPDATGVRSHRLFVHTTLRDLYPDDIGYESNYMMYGSPGIEPFWVYENVVQMPIYFMDDMWMRRGGDEPSLQTALQQPGLKIFCFHPVHVFTNSPSIEFYESVKEHYNDVEKLRDMAVDGFGTRSVFIDLLEEIDRGEYETATLETIASEFREENPYESVSRV